MKNGGFDVVIGNPPYVFGRDWKSLNISNDVKR
jgi:methylase of polypeptide subunit release factors